MSQWFRGRLEGHYVGIAGSVPAVSQFGTASAFKLRIYRALIRDIEVLEPGQAGTKPEESTDQQEAELPPDEIPEGCFYQAQIDDTRLIGIRPQTCFEGAVYDVAVSGMQVTHSTIKNGKTYGRVVGEVYGRFLMPESAELAPVVPQALEAMDDVLIPGSEAPVAALGEELAKDKEPSGRGTDKESTGQSSDDQELHPPSAPSEPPYRLPSTTPLPLFVIVVAISLALSSGLEPALLWLGVFFPIGIVRLILRGQFEYSRVHRVVGSTIVLAQLACLAVILSQWWMAECMEINVWAVGGIGVAVLATCVLPSAYPLICTGTSLGLILFFWYGEVGVTCESLKPEIQEIEPSGPPSVRGPGSSRTNDDGSWPRRAPR